ncbi:hypothetical protein C8J57DRAFT_1601962 [Mycena rebaudengoi]|nr:hypothetical protein C8J57DRAFT_1601962 [Mycena rebaudengoi]
MRVGTQIHRTKSARGMAPHAWNEKFAFDLAGSEDLFLGLYRTRLFGQPIMISSVTVHTDLEPRNQHLPKKFPSSNKRRPMTVIYQLRELGKELEAPQSGGLQHAAVVRHDVLGHPNLEDAHQMLSASSTTMSTKDSPKIAKRFSIEGNVTRIHVTNCKGYAPSASDSCGFGDYRTTARRRSSAADCGELRPAAALRQFV